ncbi:MAG: tRNA threonylcarbamoyladenosine dehydratase [Lawsonibacter sp.]|nr:tRNA threonylcarbamoyladenosine dehydratase [Lawsonibacter sp.]
MPDPWTRTRLLIGDQPLDRLAAAKVAVFGVGGVGGFCVEALARAGVGTLHLYDDDTVSESNLNRQIVALHSTLEQPKAEVMAQRVQDINPNCDVKAIRMFYLPENANQVDLSQYDYVVDAIDTVAAKLELVSRCNALQIQVISAMGSGNKLDPTSFVVTDISKTSGCPLARVMRKELRRRGITHLKVVYSKEEPRSPDQMAKMEVPTGQCTRPRTTSRRATPGSISFVPAAAGLVMASAVIRDLGKFCLGSALFMEQKRQPAHNKMVQAVFCLIQANCTR